MAVIPEPSLLSKIRAYAADVAGCSVDRIAALSRFEDGNRHAVYKVTRLDTAEAEDLVVRVSYGGGPADCAQAEREARVLQRAGGVVAPLLYDFHRTSPWFDTPAMCMQFVPGDQKQLSSATAVVIERLGSVVARVHGLPADDLVDGDTPGNIASYAEARLQSILSTMIWVRHPLPPALQARLKSAADSVQRTWEAARGAERFSDGTLALLHGDIAPGNILWGADPVLIDWEYTRLGDPADEIAYLFDQNGLTAAQREAFWHGYQGSISTQALLVHLIDRVDWWEPLTLLGSALWWVERWVRRTDADAAGNFDPETPRDPGYYYDHVIGRLDRLDGLRGGP